MGDNRLLSEIKVRGPETPEQNLRTRGEITSIYSLCWWVFTRL